MRTTVKRRVSLISALGFFGDRPMIIVLTNFASLTDDQDFVTESCVLPKILDGKFYKVSTTVSLTYTVKATCTACSREVGGSIKSTGNFYSHIDKKHPELSQSCRAYSHIKKRCRSGDQQTLQIRRLLSKPTDSRVREIKIDASMWRPKILDGKYFELVTLWNNEKIAAICQLCHGRFRAGMNHVGNLMNHIRVRHEEHIEECKAYCDIKNGGSETTNYKRTKMSDGKVNFRLVSMHRMQIAFFARHRDD